MSDFMLIKDFLEPVDLPFVIDEDNINEAYLFNGVDIYSNRFPVIENADIVLLGIKEERGTGNGVTNSQAPNYIRKQLYSLYNWHNQVQLADIGNIKAGKTLQDTYAAVKTVVAELVSNQKTVVLLGGSHDLTLTQYAAYVHLQKIIEACCIDALINLSIGSKIRSDNFLMEMLTNEPNYIRQYSHLAFQSYFVQPNMLETMDKLRFDCYRLGMVKEKLEEMEPIIRSAHLLSIDIAAIAHAYAPANHVSPNGLNGEEICTLTQYAGMSDVLSTMGIYGYKPENDIHELTAKQIAQMIWYFIDGRQRAKAEADLGDRHNFTEYHTSIAETDTLFLKSKRTQRWWMELPNGKIIACSENDYQQAIHSIIPERWLRAQERD